MAKDRRTRARTARRICAAVLSLFLLSGLSAGARADTKKDLSNAEAELNALEDRIDQSKQALEDQQAKVDAVQADLNKVAGALDDAQTQYDAIQGQVMATRIAYQDTRAHYRRVRSRLDARARSAYENGPAGDISIILGSGSISDLSDAVEFMSSVSENDTELAADVQNQSNALRDKRNDFEALEARQADILLEFQRQEGIIDAKFDEQQQLLNERQDIVNGLTADQNRVLEIIAKYKKKLKAEALARARAATHGGPVAGGGPGPLYVCPVDQPRGYGDSFGAPRYAGGYHPHAGNDIMAPEGTPVRAPFDGVVEEDYNGLGGNAIIEHGADGWIYGAHLSAYGATGQVAKGEIIGYVGNTGDAQGGPMHLHFEWHPNVIPSNPYRSIYGYTVIGSAVDPYPYLNEIC
ncbi:MAG TPA: peptidoglycan DD-metalloendopeptidase family protein [Actinomycetota bacterium]